MSTSNTGKPIQTIVKKKILKQDTKEHNGSPKKNIRSLSEGVTMNKTVTMIEQSLNSNENNISSSSFDKLRHAKLQQNNLKHNHDLEKHLQRQQHINARQTTTNTTTQHHNNTTTQQHGLPCLEHLGPLAPPLPPPSVSSLIAVISRAPASLGQGDRWSARGRGAAQVQ